MPSIFEHPPAYVQHARAQRSGLPIGASTDFTPDNFGLPD